MDKRKSEILIRLSENAFNECSLASLSELYQVSEKTIRNDVKEINRFLEEHNAKKVEFLGNGSIKLFVDQSIIAQLLESPDLYTYKLEKQERKIVAAFILVHTSGYVTINSLAEQLFVSRATILNDLKDVKQFILTHQLTVISHPNKGLIVEGNELHRRKLIDAIYTTFIKSHKLNQSSFHFLNMFFLNLLEHKKQKEVIKKIIIEVGNFHQISLTEESFERLLFYLIVMVNRLQNGFSLSKVRVENEVWFEMATNIIERITQYCDITIDENEIRMLNNIFSSLNYLKNKNDDSKIVKFQLITRRFIEEVSKDLDIDLNGDYVFFENLVSHLCSLSMREHTMLPVEEVFGEQEIPVDVYRAVNLNLNIIQRTLNKSVNETELYYIVIHVCAAIERKKFQSSQMSILLVCMGGVGTSQLIAARLRNHFNFELLDIVAKHDLENRLSMNKKIDLIISTVPLLDIELEHIVVNPMLTGNDIAKIYEKVERVKKENIHTVFERQQVEKQPSELLENVQNVVAQYMNEIPFEMQKELSNVVHDFFKEEEKQQPSLHRLLQPEYIQLDVSCECYEEAIFFSAQKLLNNGFIEETYIQEMVRNIKEYGPYIVIAEGFAVPHASVEDGSNRVGMNLVRLKKAVDFSGKQVKYVCCLSVVDGKKHMNAFFHLVNLLQNELFIHQLDVAQTPEQLSLIIKEFERQCV